MNDAEDDLAAMRGLVNGLPVAAVLWVLLYFAARALWRLL